MFLQRCFKLFVTVQTEGACHVLLKCMPIMSQFIDKQGKSEQIYSNLQNGNED
jgi:hypothetical protein